MDREYLPGDVRDRISDLSNEYGISQNEIARRIGMSEGTFSRFMSGFTDKLSYKYVIKIAALFIKIKTDTEIPISSRIRAVGPEILDLILMISLALDFPVPEMILHRVRLHSRETALLFSGPFRPFKIDNIKQQYLCLQM